MAPLFFYVNYKSIFSWCCHTRFSSLRRHCSGYEEVVSQVAARIPKSWAAVMIFVPHRLHPSRHQAGPLAVHLKVVAVSHLRCFTVFHFGAPGVLLSSFQHPGVTPNSLIGDEGPWSAVEGSDSHKPFASAAALKRECNPAGAANTLDFQQLATSNLPLSAHNQRGLRQLANWMWPDLRRWG